MTKVWVVADIAAFARQHASNPFVAYVDRNEAYLHVKITHNTDASVSELDVAGDVKAGYQLWLVCDTAMDGKLSAATRTKAAAIKVADRPGCYGHALEWVTSGIFLGLWDTDEDFVPDVAEAVIAPVAISARFRP